MIQLEDFPECFLLIYERLKQAEAELNALDAEVGDGDHGSTMARAFRAAAAAAQRPADEAGAVFDSVAQSLAENAGGAIGPLLAALFAEGGEVFRGKESISLEDFGIFLRRGYHAVMEVGGARAGEKTLIDALIPAVDAIQVGGHHMFSAGLQAAADAAFQGAQATKEMTASKGRASFAAPRSRGKPDAGATSMALILQAFADFSTGARPSLSLAEGEKEFTPPQGRFINHPDSMVREDNEGLALAYPDLVRLQEDGILLRARPKEGGKVALVIGHGGGHTPSMGGFIGSGLLDADVYGPLFTCASGIRISRAVELADRGGGVVLLVSNHSGDVLNARLAVRRALNNGTRVEPVLLGDDIATAPRAHLEGRRGLGGLLFALKIGGAAAELGRPLDQVAEVMRKTNERTATLMAAGRPPAHPVSGEPLFTLPDGQIEIGAGVHGEVGVYRGEHLPADQIIDLLIEELVDDLAGFEPERMLVFVNGAGGTSMMELHILFRRAFQAITGRGISVAGGVAKSLFTTLEMGGFSLSLCVPDDEMLALWDQPASAPHFRWPNR